MFAAIRTTLERFRVADGRLHERGRPAPLGRGGARARARPRRRPRLRGRGRDLAARERVRRRQGPRAASRPTARRRTSRATSRTSSTSSSAASISRSTCSAPTTTATPRACSAAAQALGYDPQRIEIALYQMVHLIEDGEQKRMSKRRGDVVLLDELMDGIGVDAARFYLVQRSHDATIDIDLAQAVEQGPENPVYYVQYAHARICSILRRAGETAGGVARRRHGARAERGRPRARARRLPRRLPRGRRAARAAPRRRLRARPRRRPSRRSTATARCSTPDTPERESSRLALCDATRQVLARALDLVGVSAPEEM